MKSEQEIRERLSELREQYRSGRGVTTREAEEKATLEWVLDEDE